MTAREVMVANEAIKIPPAATYEEIYSKIVISTGIPSDEVKAVMERLSAEGFLIQHGRPAHNLMEGWHISGSETAKGWYERGSLWKE